MTRTVAALACVLLLGFATNSFGTSATEPPPSKERIALLRETLRAVIAEGRKENPDQKASVEALKAIIADPVFFVLSDEERHVAYLMYAAILFDQGNYDAAQLPITEATKLAQAGELDWGLRFQDAFRREDLADAAIALTVLAQHWPKKLVEYNDAAIARVARKVCETPASEEIAVAMLNAFFSIKWQPTNPYSNADGLWVPLIRIRLEHGDVAGAKAAATLLVDPSSMIQLRADKRFDPITQANPEQFDVMKTYRVVLADFQAKSSASPEVLEGLNAIAEIQLKLDQTDAAIAITSDALARIKEKPTTFTDLNDQINWTLDVRSRALFAEGRSDEGFAAMVEGASQKENSDVNISQAINLAGQLDVYDRPKDALKAVEMVDRGMPSDYGRMALADARACAYFELADNANLNETLEYMRKHAKDGLQPYLNTMLFVGNLDDAAEDVIDNLKDPARRTGMLVFLQDYLPRNHATKREEALRNAWIAVRDRADVAAEIAKVGRIETYPLQAELY